MPQDPSLDRRALNPTLAWIAVFALIGAYACSPAKESTVAYPPAERSDHIDTYFDVEVADPYRWLEDLGADATRAFVEAQNALAQPRLEAIPAREKIRQRMTELWRYPRVDVPRERGGRYFFEANNGEQELDVLKVADGLGAEPRALIDPNGFREDATVALADWVPSPDGKLVAYGVSDGGTDWKTWRVRDVDSGEDLADVVGHMKFSDTAWAPDSSGFYYSRYPLGEDGTADGSAKVSVYYHRIGGSQEDDRHIYSTGDGNNYDPYPAVSEDGRFLILNLFEGYSTNAVYVRRLDEPGSSVVRLLDDWDAFYTFFGNIDDELFFRTTHRAPNGRVIAIDLENPAPGDWREVVPESDNALAEAQLIGGQIIAQYLVDASSQVIRYTADGQELGAIELPGIGTATGFEGSIDDPETFFRFETFTAPPQITRLDVASAETTPFGDASDRATSVYETQQVFFNSKDGTRVPMFLIHRPGLERNGENPTMLYGYGGFNVSETPEYLVRWEMWLEMGGLLAIANLRGGGEYGEAWHQAGTKLEKQNVFDDFIAAAEWLIAENYTQTPKLAIHGRSNGGLLVAAVTTQRPDLFGVSLPAVGVLDMLRYHTASANAYQWGSDYGWSENQDEFQAQRAYSPVHNVAAETCYPPTLITTADRDDRVVPWHSYKYAAALQHAQECDTPILLRVETRAGHGGSKPTWMRIEDYADQWAFAAEQMGMSLGD
ncbi:MAG: prolyl oligopeptidase family serine peptidase [Acidobacteriota bacterium]